MAKKFFYACLGFLVLTVSYEIGARNAGAQSGSPSFVASQGYNGGGKGNKKVGELTGVGYLTLFDQLLEQAQASGATECELGLREHLPA